MSKYSPCALCGKDRKTMSPPFRSTSMQAANSLDLETAAGRDAYLEPSMADF